MTTINEATQIQDAYPLASLQAGMLFASSYSEDSTSYHDVFTVILKGRFDAGALTAALAQQSARHAILRTSFDMVAFSEPMQLVHERAVTPLTVCDWSAHTAADAQRKLERWRHAQATKPFAWNRPPLLRVTVHLLPDGEFALSLNFHHAILDGWSLHTMVTDLMHRYLAQMDGRTLDGPPPAENFRDFVAREREAISGAVDAEYWRTVVANAPLCGVPTLPGYPDAARTGGGTIGVEIERGVHDKLVALARAEQVPLRTILLAAHLRVIGLLGGESDVLAGHVSHGRPETDGGADVLGLFVNSLPIRVRLDAPSWTALIKRVHEAELAAMDHRLFPLVEIQRLAGRTGLLGTLFDYRHFHVYEGLPGDDRLRTVSRKHDEHIDIPFTAAFSVSSAGGLSLSLKYDRSHYPDQQMRAAAGRYVTALRLMATSPGADPRRCDLFVNPAERRQLARWSTNQDPVESERSLYQFFADQAARTPNAIAVIDEAGEHSYKVIGRRANALAARLRTLGAGPEAVVGLLVNRGADFITALLGVLQTGAAALPLDPDLPAHRLLQVTADASAALLITRSGQDITFEFRGVTLSLDDAEADEPVPGATRNDSLAYLLYTSGSTGRPKGVMLTSRSITGCVSWWIKRLGIGPSDRVGQRTVVSWDIAVCELFLALASGATSVMIPTEAAADPASLTEIVAARSITVLFVVPTILAVHLGAGAFADMPSLRVVVSAGEALSQQAADAFAAQSSARLLNLYGPTEASVGVSDYFAKAGSPGVTVPIGRPIGSVALHVLDEAGRLLPAGTPGELHIGSAQLARGYLGRPWLTAETFIPDRLSATRGARLYRTGDLARWLPDGELEFLGRRDGQVKIRGVRIELGEVEAALRGHKDVAQATVLARPGRDGRLMLTAYVVSEAASDELIASLRDHLKARLPRAAVPTAIMRLDELPRLDNGKIDRSRLPAPETGARTEWIAPRNPVEARLSALWSEALNVEAVGVRDDFFDLGGDSLVALRLTMRLRHELGREIPSEIVISASTVEALAAKLSSPEDLVPSSRVVALRDRGDGPPLVIMHGLGGQVFRYQMLVNRLDDTRPAYAIPATGFVAGEKPHTSLDEMADDYANRIQALHPHGPYLLCGHCIGGNISIEVARRLRARGEQVPLVAMFWTHANEPVVKANVTDDAVLMMHALSSGNLTLTPDQLRELPAEEQLLAVINAATAAGQIVPAAEDLDHARRIVEVYRANAYAVIDYRHQPYDGDVALLVPDSDDGIEPGDLFGWDKVVTGRLDLVDIPGTRLSCLDEPLVKQTAAILRARMTDALAAGAAPAADS